MNPIQPPLTPADSTYDARLWAVFLFVGVFVCTFGSFLFGLPTRMADGNYALFLTESIMSALRAGDWLPTWAPLGNAGFGAPVFYYYCRMSYLIMGAVGVLLRLSPVHTLQLGIGGFRLFGFFTCRQWLRDHSTPRAADCGALAFVAFPFAMTYVPVDVGSFAAIAATSWVPLFFMFVDRLDVGYGNRLRNFGWLALLYAVILFSHLPTALLTAIVVTLYTCFLKRGALVLTNLAAMALGLLVCAFSVLPAIVMQPLINAGAWTADTLLDIRNNFLFTLAQYRIYGFHTPEIILYVQWFLFGVIILAVGWRTRVRKGVGDRRTVALSILAAACLFAVTPLLRPLWYHVPQLRVLQSPIRIFACLLSVAAALVAVLIDRDKRYMKWAVVFLVCLFMSQFSLTLMGATISYSQSNIAAEFKKLVGNATPAYVPATVRASSVYTKNNTIAPEYIPKDALKAGWHQQGPGGVLVPPSGFSPVALVPPETLTESSAPDGSILIQGNLTAPTVLLLKSFFFPDEEAAGSPGVIPSADPATGLTRLELPAGAVSLRVVHDLPVRSVMIGRYLSVLGLLGLIALFGASFYSRPSVPDSV